MRCRTAVADLVVMAGADTECGTSPVSGVSAGGGDVERGAFQYDWCRCDGEGRAIGLDRNL